MSAHTTHRRRPAANAIGAIATILASIALLVLPALAHAAIPVAPIEGGHLQYLSVNPTVAFDVPTGETPKWVLIGTDAGMATTVRYCRQFGGGSVTPAMMGSTVSTNAVAKPAAGSAAAAAVAAPSGRAIITSVGTASVMPANLRTPFIGTAPAGVISSSATATALTDTNTDSSATANTPTPPAGVHWTCRAWAIGADAYGGDQVKPLEWGHTYWWQVVSSKDSDKSEVKSAIRSFTIDNPDPGPDPTALSDQIFGSVLSDGTTLNKGDAAFVNSGLSVKSLTSTRPKPDRTIIKLAWLGGIDLSRSYVTVRGEGMVRRLLLHRTSTMGIATATWIRTTAQNKLPTGRYTYQAFLVSVRNGALVKSNLHQVVVIGPKQKSTTSGTRVINI